MAGPRHDDADETAPPAPDSLDSILAAGHLRSFFQPIVELDTGAVVAWESLPRGPEGSGLIGPEQLFAEARRLNRLSELDRACRAAAFDGARAAGMNRLWTLLVNTEPDIATSAFGAARSPAASPAAGGEMNVIVELPERALVDSPVELLHLAKRIRARGWGTALTDVGADRASLALLPLLRPDVIKLNSCVVRHGATADVAELIGAVNAEAERSRSVIIAAGIDTVEHLATARSLGATHGQGGWFGAPGPLPARLPPFDGATIAVARTGDSAGDITPYEFGAALQPPRTASKALLMEFSKHLEHQAAEAGRTAILLATFQNASVFGKNTRARYADLVRRVAFVGVLGEEVGIEPLPGVRGGLLAANDPLVDEWNVAVVTPHYAATLIAREIGDARDYADLDRPFKFVFSHDRALAISVASYLMDRVSPSYTFDAKGSGGHGRTSCAR